MWNLGMFVRELMSFVVLSLQSRGDKTWLITFCEVQRDNRCTDIAKSGGKVDMIILVTITRSLAPLPDELLIGW